VRGGARSMTAAYFFYQPDAFTLPWATRREDRQRLRRWLGVCLLVVTVGGVVVRLIDLPEPTRAEQEALPPRLARIVMERPQPVIPPPPKPEPKEREEVEPEPRPEPEVAREVEPEPRPAVADAREKAASSGLLQFS